MSTDDHGDFVSLKSPGLYSNPGQRVSVSSAPANWFSTDSEPMTSTSIGRSDLSVTRTSSVMNTQSSRSFSACGCLPRALALLNHLAPNNLASPQTQGIDLESAPSFENVMLQNEESIDAIKDILDCSCSKDGSLLFTLSLVVFKILGWYAAAALAVPIDGQIVEGEVSDSPRHSRLVVRLQPTSMLGYDVDGENQKRIICQFVLSKLHSVQRIVNMLSQRLLALARKKFPTKSSCDHIANAAQDLLLDEIMFNHSTSGELARDLEAGLRCRLRELCQAIMDTLVDS
nr:monodictyphenone cluster transcription factor [Quercus suber]